MPEPTAPAGAERTKVISEFFDRRADDYDREYHAETPGGYALRVRREIVFNLFDQPGGKVLDVGCGPGVMTQNVLDQGAQYWGVDASPRMIEIGQSRFEGRSDVHFAVGTAGEIVYPTGYFDAVLCIGVIDSVPDTTQAIREMLRVLKPGGTLVLAVTNLTSPYAWWKTYVFYPAVTAYQWLRAQLGDSSLDPGRIRSGGRRSLFTLSGAKAVLQQEGGEVLEAVGYHYNIFLSPLDELMPNLALRVTRKLEERQWPRPDGLALGWVLKVRKVGDPPGSGR